ncbi:MAG: pyruvate kinase [Ottowia sp.]|nr:pyruvate kinase [Ottowia sp.]
MQHFTRILATLGPATAGLAQIRALADAGVDAFRLNFSHGSQAEHAVRIGQIRQVEQELGRPLGVLMDLQGPKLRIGRFAQGPVVLAAGASFRLDMDAAAGDAGRVQLPHAEVFAALKAGAELLLDDGKLRLRVTRCGADFAETRVVVGGALSDHKGLNVPGVLLPIAALTDKDRADLEFGLAQGVDWVALSFVQRARDVAEVRALMGGRAWIMAKLEKPAAIDQLDAILAEADGIMIARGDLGVELPPQRVPVLQQKIVRLAREAGKPVVVATQMLESMVHAPVPTRAEVSDVATAVYSGADAVMLSAESAVGDYPVRAVTIMRQIADEVEADPSWHAGLAKVHGGNQASVPDAICVALQSVAAFLRPAVTIAYTATGASALRASRERPMTPILALASDPAVARRLTLCWGMRPVHFPDRLRRPHDMIAHATRHARSSGLARPGDFVVVIAGLPFGKSGSTNLLHIAQV